MATEVVTAVVTTYEKAVEHFPTLLPPPALAYQGGKDLLIVAGVTGAEDAIKGIIPMKKQAVLTPTRTSAHRFPTTEEGTEEIRHRIRAARYRLAQIEHVIGKGPDNQ